MTVDLRDVARETLEILRTGGYGVPGGGQVGLADEIRAAVAGTRLYRAGSPVPAPPGGGAPPVVEVTGESTLAAARRLAAGGPVAALVFASAKHPGGGFRNGARAQEEDLARASALYSCLSAAPEFYAHHRTLGGHLYSDAVIHSPEVPVFRGDDLALLGAPYRVSLLTAAAPNRGAVPAARAGQVSAALSKRARKVLAVAAAEGHRQLVLGAWGCGVFRNDPAVVAGAFAEGLEQSAGSFDRVVFAVLDNARGAPVRSAFAARLL